MQPKSPHKPHVAGRRRIARVSGAAIAALAITVSSAASANTALAAELAFDSVSSADSEVNRNLDSMAKIFASAVADEGFRQDIHDGVAKKFDGDENVLWSDLSSSTTVQSELASAYSNEAALETSESRSTTATALSAVESLSAGIPRFQVAVPENFEDWDPKTYAPLVAYMPEGVDDTTLQTVTAYDSAGNAHELDAQVAPEQPVIVLGVNERTDDSGALLPEMKTLTETETDASVASLPMAESSDFSTLAASRYAVRMVKVHLIHDLEPWTKGNAEIMLRAKSRGCSDLRYTNSYINLDHDSDWWHGPVKIGSTTCDVVFKWWENDGNSHDYTLAYGKFSLNVHMDDGDDIIGGIQMAHSVFSGGSNNKRSWSALEQWTD